MKTSRTRGTGGRSVAKLNKDGCAAKTGEVLRTPKKKEPPCAEFYLRRFREVEGDFKRALREMRRLGSEATRELEDLMRSEGRK